MLYRRGLKKNFSSDGLFPLLVWGSIFLSWVGVVLNKMTGMPYRYFVAVVLVFSFVFSNSRLKNQVKVSDYVLFVSIALLYILLWATNIENFKGFEDDVPRFLLLVLPYFFAGLVLNQSEHSRSFWLISSATILVEILYAVVYTQNRVDVETGFSSQMGLAFSLLPHVSYLWLYFFSKKKVGYLVIAIIGELFLLSLGNRGSVVQSLLFIVIYVIFFTRLKENLLASLIVMTLSFLVYYYSDTIFLSIQILFEQLGLSSRVLDFAQSDDFVSGGSGRDFLYAKIWNEILHHPLAGQGLYADRAIIGAYTHNFILEFLVSFGFPIAIMLLLILCIMFLKAFRSFVSLEEKAFLVVLLVSGFGLCMTSSTVWHEPYVFIAIGYAISIIRKGKTLQN